jgi:hypothetical protein
MKAGMMVLNKMLWDNPMSLFKNKHVNFENQEWEDGNSI